MGLTVDQVLEHIGSFGYYQIRLLCILSFIEWFPVGFQVLLMTFIAAEPKWQCVANSSECTVSGQFTPGHEYYKKRCNMNRSQWEFTNEFTSVATEFDLVCNKTSLASLSSSLIFAGWLLGALVGGWIADRFGRKILMMVFTFLAALFGLLGAFAKVYWVFALFRLLVGISIGAGGMPIFVLMTEYVGVKHRHTAGTAIWFSWVASLISLGGFAYFIRQWKTLTIVTSSLGLLGIFFWSFVPESTRFLLVKGRHSETEDILKKVAEANKKEYPTHEKLVEYKAQKTGDFRDLFKSWKMIHRTFVSWISWFVNALVYYGVILSSPNLGGNMYLNYTITSAVELPAYVLGIWTMGRFGRKKSVVWGLVLAALASVGAVLCTMYDPGDDVGFLVGRIVMACVAKLAVSISFAAIYVYSAELFPTVVRSIAMGTSNSTARLGSFASPYIATLNRIHLLLPYAVMGTASLIAGVLCMTLPETMNMPLDEVMDQEPGEEVELGTAKLGSDNMGVECVENGTVPNVEFKQTSDKNVEGEIKKDKIVATEVKSVENTETHDAVMSEGTGNQSAIGCDNPADALSDEREENCNEGFRTTEEEIVSTKF